MANATPTVDQKEPGIRKVYSPEGEEAQILKHVYDRYWRMRDSRNGSQGGYYNIEGDWDKWERQWNAYRPPKDADDWRSNIYIPLTTSIIEAQLSEVVEQDPIPWAVGRSSKDIPKAAVINACMQFSFDNGKFNLALFDILKDAFICGTGIGQEYYWREEREIKDKDGKKQRMVEFDDCYLEPVRLWDFFIDEVARGFTGPYAAQDCIRRYIMDYDDFRTFFQGKWDPMGNAELVKPGGDTNYYEFYIPPDRIEHSRQVEVLWYWNKPSDLLSIVANDVNVFYDANPYKHKQLPFVRAIDIKRPHQFYGKGECEILESLQDEINTLRRMTIDRNHLDIDKPVFVNDTLTLEDEDTIARPHGIIPVGDVSGIKFAEYSDIPASVFQQLNMLNDDKVRITGMDERQQSVAGSGTATEASILKEATLKRMNMKMWHMKNDTLIDIGRLRVENILQFYTQPKLEKILNDKQMQDAQAMGRLVKQNGQNYEANYRNVRLIDQQFGLNPDTQEPEITPSKGFTFFEALPEYFLPEKGGYDIIIKGTESIPLSKPLMQQKADEMYDRLVKNPAIDISKLSSYLLKSRDLDPDDFIKAPQGQPGQPGQGQQPGQPGQPGQQGGQQGLIQGQGLQKIIDLAGIENSEMLKGNKIGPTPFAPVAHTQVHLEFMKSKDFKESKDPKILQIFATHVMGEIMAQHARQAQGNPGQPPGGADVGQAPAPAGGSPAGNQPSSGADVGATMNQVLPGMIQGGADTQNVSGAQQQ
jgi:hypothetical protein